MAGSASPRKPKVRHADQVGGAPHLARGMPVEREHRVLAPHAGAVVAHLDQRLAAVLQLDPHVARAGVERVLDQLLDHGSRALDHLARGDLVGDGVGQDGDAASHRPESIRRRSRPPRRPPSHAASAGGAHEDPTGYVTEDPQRAAGLERGDDGRQTVRREPRGVFGRARWPAAGCTRRVVPDQRRRRGLRTTSSTSQRSRTRGRSDQPSQPPIQARLPKSSSSSGVTGGDQVQRADTASGGGVSRSARRTSSDRGAEPAGLGPGRGRAPRLALPIEGRTEVVPVGADFGLFARRGARTPRRPRANGSLAIELLG